MPTYDYSCNECKNEFELFHSISDASVKACPKCGSASSKLFGNGGGILYKGAGFYTTDYRKPEYTAKAKAESGN